MRARLLLVTDAVGGVWVYSLELARALRQLGIDTVIAVIGPSPCGWKSEQADGFRLIDTHLPLEWLATDPGEVRRAGKALAGLADREGADIVQTSSAALLADTSFNQPCVAMQHSCVASWWAAVKGTALPHEFVWRRDLVERGLLRASAVVAPSISFAAETARTYDVTGAVTAVHNGRTRMWSRDVPQGDFVFTAGRLWDEGKNLATLDAAASRMRVPLQAAGSVRGPNGAAINVRHVEVLGELGKTRLGGLYAARPIYASAALYEPFGLSVLEAAHAGCALVLSDIPTHREIWGGAAIFVPARDDAAFSVAIQDLIDDPDERQQLGQLARARAAHYTVERMAHGMADIYARLTASSSQPLRIAGAA
ncbi:MAG: glycosyltransferase family 4 protein [Sphingomicrobium sp.]